MVPNWSQLRQLKYAIDLTHEPFYLGMQFFTGVQQFYKFEGSRLAFKQDQYIERTVQPCEVDYGFECRCRYSYLLPSLNDLDLSCNNIEALSIGWYPSPTNFPPPPDHGPE